MRIDSFLCAECCRDPCRLTRCTDGRNDTNRRLDKEITADTASRNKQVVNISDNDRAERDFKVRLFVFDAIDMFIGIFIAEAMDVDGIVGLCDRIVKLGIALCFRNGQNTVSRNFSRFADTDH